MSDSIDTLFAEEPAHWISCLPTFQREAIEELLSKGLNYDEAAKSWASASAENTFGFSTSGQPANKGAFLANLKVEVRRFLCGDKKYKTERDGLFGQRGLARTYVVTQIAVAISPHISVASAVISPIIALVLASFGKIALNAWCSIEDESKSS